jgi:hypothetical protein
MIIPVRWSQVANNFRVVLPTGRVVVCLWVNAQARTALLRDDAGDTRPLEIDPDAVVPMVVDDHERAVSCLAARFPQIEFRGRA